MDVLIAILKTPACISLIATIIAAIVYRVFKINMDFNDIITAIMNEVATRNNAEIAGDTGVMKKVDVVTEINRKFADPEEKWWTQKKKNLILKRIGSIPAAVEKAWTMWSAASALKKIFK